jgi:hypothetical protein
MITVMLVLILLSYYFGWKDSDALKPAPVPEFFRSLLPQIKRGTIIPVLLPSVVPPKWAGYRLHSSIESAADAWKVIVEVTPKWGNACMVGYIEAKRGDELPASDEVDKVVALTYGIKGYYTGISGDGSCTVPQIIWGSGGIIYTIQFSVDSWSGSEDEAVIVRMAKSAIAAGPR